jgi:hypothetical protein
MISLADVVHISNLIENLLQVQRAPVTRRNRAARRRKPNAFHWLDENWGEITPAVYDPAVFAVLGTPAPSKAKQQKAQN